MRKMKIKEVLEELFYRIDDLFVDLRFFLRESKKNRERTKKGLSRRPVHNQINLKKLGIGAAGILVCFLAVFLIVTGIRKGISAVSGRQISAKPEQIVMSETEKMTEETYPEQDITIGSTGCMLLHSPFISSYPDAQGNYDFSSVYQYITPYYSEPDFMTCEFEGSLSGPEAGYYGYPTFRSPDAIIENIRDSGVDLQMLATNHIYDAWSDGFHRTMDVYEEKGIAYTGIRKNTDEKPYYIADIKGVTVGFIDYVYETPGEGTNLNGLKLTAEDGELVNSFSYDDLQPFYDEMSGRIREMKEDGARFIVLNLHWGTEYQLTESSVQDEIAQKMCDLGVDALIGGHPHCEQPIDVLNAEDGSRKMFCIYSVGNALSNQRTYLMNEMPTGHTEDGVMVTLTLHQEKNGTVRITSVDILPTWVYRFQENGSKYYILPLDDVDHLEELTGLTDAVSDARASYERTMEELEPGLEKARQAFHK